MIVDPFAGPGGWSEGLRQLGLSDVGIELDGWACATRAAAGHLTIRADVATYPLEAFAGRVEGLIASPPCQDFSRAGKRAGVNGATGRLVSEVMRWAEALRPVWIACEQVPDVLPIWRQYAWRLQQLGYSTWAGLLNAANYGVPQTRVRAFLLAHRERPALPPEPTHCRGGRAAPAHGPVGGGVRDVEAGCDGPDASGRKEGGMSRSLTMGTPTPVHDAMVAWTHQAVIEGGLLDELVAVPPPYANRAAAERRLREIEEPMERTGPVYGRLSDERWASQQAWRAELIERYPRTIDAPPIARVEVREVKWEAPIDNSRGVIVGNVGLRVELAVPCWTYGQYFEWEARYESEVVYFDAKPEIPSVGELLRQINKYRHYVKGGVWVVVSPEVRFKGLLESQGVRLVVPSAQLAAPLEFPE